MRIPAKAFSSIYFGVQRLRSGVSEDQISAAARLLDSSWAQCEAHAIERLRMVHGRNVDWTWLRARAPTSRSELGAAAAKAIETAPSTTRFEVRKTSGSTGTPFRFPKDRQMTAWMDAAMWAGYAWHGVRPGDPHVRFWGMPLAWTRRLNKRLGDALLNRQRVDAFRLRPATVRKWYFQLRARHATYAYGYPSLIRAFIEMCRAQELDGRELGLRVVISTGELLSPIARREIESFFECRVVNEYGCTESGVIGLECERGVMHALPVATWPEIVAYDGTPVRDDEGEVVVTDLYGQVFPLVRYRLRDRGISTSKVCECGRELVHLEISSGRSDSFIQTPSGPVYDAILAYSAPSSVQRFRVWQVSQTELLAHVVPGAGCNESVAAAEAAHAWERALQGQMRVSVVPVSDIPPEPSGKLRYFVPASPEPAGELQS